MTLARLSAPGRHSREVVLELSKEMLAFEDEPFYIGLRLRSKTVQVCLLHDLIVVTGAQKRLVQPCMTSPSRL